MNENGTNVGNPNVGGEANVTSTVNPVENSIPSVQPLPANLSNPVNVVPPTTPVVENSVGVVNTDPGAVVNEDLKKVEINYTPPSKFKVFMMIFFFILLIAFVIFLPEITSYVHLIQSGKLNQEEEKITTGKMTCTLKNHTTNLDKDYNVVFSFAGNKLEKTQITVTTKGDVTLDEEILDEINNTCEQLSKNVKNINGVSVSCDYIEGKVTEYQNFDLANINAEQLDSAFTEAGGNQPNYTYGQDMDSIEKNMKISNYECTRTR